MLGDVAVMGCVISRASHSDSGLASREMAYRWGRTPWSSGVTMSSDVNRCVGATFRSLCIKVILASIFSLQPASAPFHLSVQDPQEERLPPIYRNSGRTL